MSQTEETYAERLERHADIDGPLEQLGTIGGEHTRYANWGAKPVYHYTDGTSLIKWVDGGDVKCMKRSELLELAQLALKDADSKEVCDVLTASAGQFDPEDMGMADRICMALVLLPETLRDQLADAVNDE